MTCSVDGCEKPKRGRGMCVMHYQRFMKYGDANYGENIRNHAPPEIRFWRGVDKRGEDDCWNYVRGAQRGRYGLFQPGGKGSPHVGAHRYSYELSKGSIPEGLFVLHSCDNPRCVNPKHLSVGTPKDNTMDMIAKGRWGGVPIGENVASSKLKDADVIWILNNKHIHSEELAAKFGVSRKSIVRIKNGSGWKHINRDKGI